MDLAEPAVKASHAPIDPQPKTIAKSEHMCENTPTMRDLQSPDAGPTATSSNNQAASHSLTPPLRHLDPWTPATRHSRKTAGSTGSAAVAPSEPLDPAGRRR